MQVAATGNGDAPADQTRDPERTVTGSIRLGILSMAWQTILHRFWYSNLKLRLLAEGAGEGLQAQAGDSDRDPEQRAEQHRLRAGLAERGHVGG